MTAMCIRTALLLCLAVLLLIAPFSHAQGAVRGRTLQENFLKQDRDPSDDVTGAQISTKSPKMMLQSE